MTPENGQKTKIGTAEPKGSHIFVLFVVVVLFYCFQMFRGYLTELQAHVMCPFIYTSYSGRYTYMYEWMVILRINK